MQNEREKLNFNFESNQAGILNLYDNLETELSGSFKRKCHEDTLPGSGVSMGEIDIKIDSVEAQMKILPAKEMKSIKVKREFDVNNTVYTYLLEKRAETGIARASIVSDNRKIDDASYIQGRSCRTERKKNFIIALLLGFLVPMIVIILIDFFNDKVIDKQDIEKKTKVPVIGYISHSEGKKKIAVVENPASSLSESFRAIRTSLKYYIKENEKTVIAVSSTISSEGKTFISINLAAIIAMLGKKVLFIGLDLRKPQSTRLLNLMTVRV